MKGLLGLSSIVFEKNWFLTISDLCMKIENQTWTWRRFFKQRVKLAHLVKQKKNSSFLKRGSLRRKNALAWMAPFAPFKLCNFFPKIIDEGRNRPQVKINWQKCLFIFFGKFIARNGKCYDSASLSDLQLIFPPCFISGEKISYLGTDSSVNFTIVKFKLRSAKISIFLLLFSVGYYRRLLLCNLTLHAITLVLGPISWDEVRSKFLLKLGGVCPPGGKTISWTWIISTRRKHNFMSNFRGEISSELRGNFLPTFPPAQPI